MRRHRLISLAAALSSLALLAAACGDDGGATVAGNPGQGDGGGGSDSGGMAISIAEPAADATVEPGFEVQADVSVDIGEPDTGLHHVHIYYDGNTSDGEYDIVYGLDEPWTVERDLDPGEHTIEAVIANADHSLTDARDDITVTVDEGGGAGGGDTTNTSGSNPGY